MSGLSKKQENNKMKTHQDSVRQSEEKPGKEINLDSFFLEALLQNIPDSIYFKDTQSRFVRISQSMLERFHQRDAEQILGKTDFDIQDAEHAQQAFNDEQRIIKTGRPLINIIEKETHQDKTIHWVSSTKLPLKGTDNEMIGVFGISRDITSLIEAKEELKERNEELASAEEELRQNIEELKTVQEELLKQQKALETKNRLIVKQNRELEKHRNHLEQLVDMRTSELMRAKVKAEESDRLKSAFLANLSHEIRTPMNSIVGFANLLLNEDRVSDEMARYVSYINGNAKTLLFLINDILDLSMLESDQFEIHEETFDLNGLVADVFSSMEAMHVNPDVKLLCYNYLDSENYLLKSDRLRIKQILINLLSNAEKFTSRGEIIFSVVQNNQAIEFSVKDTGIGIPQNDLENIFKRFQKSESKLRLYRGAGLGLTISKKLANYLGGDLAVKSVLDLGSYFYLTFPDKLLIKKVHCQD
ncbi:MAG TPA: hypothetical protein DCQ26_15890 [Marinilabiliales bacterium]|nr:MAG: hypothetical protein A2W84_05125 [Bacteroidetes bacterium GWC2_40_13]OFX75474.1 MAG: hypothetical protein A2W96_08445 [Bacteroidetes bacterium GWD2_40_43]OFX93989.1 MAG: hypothetical protein A2W97_14370 [Bacteroidetes bacterium GWE2_40_63]OFY19778.1 MAG: hypothetical protein A2W88_03240 [Bacteroidetes bacterium GWF2_40_13]OFZ28189.1 MAG: hypothetical protein A2437_04740 [Bacteroidetes bacterium RIFOXYC2_FULL_40_12]HAN00081.1 hypothetical protein [Marinilabiliales bacterium]